MRKIVVQMMLSLDGYFEGPHHEGAHGREVFVEMPVELLVDEIPVS